MSATRDSWTNTPLPEQRARLTVDYACSGDQLATLARGFIPEVMEEKWFSFMEDDWLQLHRSWTGYCIYRVRFERTPDGARVAEAWVSRDKAQYGSTDDADDAATLLRLLADLANRRR